MDTVSTHPLDTLSRLEPDERGTWLRTHGDDSVLLRIGQELQAMCFSDIDGAVKTSEWLVAAADSSKNQAFFCRCLCLRAFVLSVSNRFDESLQALDRATLIADAMGSPGSLAGVAQTAVQPLVRLGRYREAIQSAEKAIRLYDEAGDSTAVARAHSNLGVVHRMLGDVEKALTHFDQALPGLAEDKAATAQVQSNRAEALLDLAEFRKAELAFRAALSSFQDCQMKRAAAIVAGNIADLMGQQGRLNESLAYFERARRTFEEGGAAGDAARIESEAAEVLSAIGLLEDAQITLRESVEVLLSHGMRREAARAMLVQGAIARRLRDDTTAKSCLTRAAAISAELGWRIGVGRANVESARVAIDAQHFQHAESLLEDALRDLSADSQDRAEALLLQASLFRQDGRLTAAARSVALAGAVADSLGSLTISARVSHERSLQSEAQGELEDALNHLQKAIDAAERQRGEIQSERARSAWTGGNRRLYEDLCEVALRLRNTRSAEIAFNSVERAKSRSLLELLQSGPIVSDQHLEAVDADTIDLIRRHRDARGELRALYARASTEVDSAEDSRSKATRRRRAEELERTLTYLEGRLSNLKRNGSVYSEPINIAEAVRLASDRMLIIEYFECRDSIGVFLINSDGVTAVPNLCSIAALEKSIDAARFQIDRGIGTDHDGERGQRLLMRAERAFQGVYNLILRPIQNVLSGMERCVFVPTGSLHGFPFGALHNGRRWLAEEHFLTVAPSASVLSALTNSRRTDSGPVRLVGVGDVQAPEIDAEISAIREVYSGGCQVLTGDQATASRVFADLQPGHTLHLACHGELGNSDPLSARIRLADRWLTARELVTLDLKGARVILSCCDVGRGRLQSGDELFGMLRSVLAGGASSVIAGSWPAHDSSTKELMVGLHANLSAGSTTSLGEALGLAQRTLIRENPHPSRWATFSAIGSNQ